MNKTTGGRVGKHLTASIAHSQKYCNFLYLILYRSQEYLPNPSRAEWDNYSW